MPLPADRLPANLRTLPAKVAALERQLRELQAARRLEHASIDGGAITIRDSTGAVRGTLGNQPDGTVALSTVIGPTPPTPSDPVVTAELAALGVTWDGTFVGAANLPADWLRIEVHVSADPAFVPSQATLRQTIETPAGGTVLIPLPYTPWYVRLRSVTTSGAVSDPTNAVAGTPRQAGTDDITADAITGKTITGGTITGALIQTADTGRAVVLNQDDNNAIQIYDAANNIVLTLGGDSGVISLPDLTGSKYEIDITGGIISFMAAGGGGILTPHFQVYGHDDTVFFNTQLAGGTAMKAGYVAALVPGSDTLYTWQTPSYATNWLASTTFNASTNWGSFQFRKDAEDNLILLGCFKAGTTAPSATVCTLPAGYRPTKQWPVPIQMHTGPSGAGTFFAGMAEIGSSGNLNLLSQNGLSIAAGAEYLIAGIVPLGNLP